MRLHAALLAALLLATSQWPTAVDALPLAVRRETGGIRIRASLASRRAWAGMHVQAQGDNDVNSGGQAVLETASDGVAVDPSDTFSPLNTLVGPDVPQPKMETVEAALRDEPGGTGAARQREISEEMLVPFCLRFLSLSCFPSSAATVHQV